MSSRTRAAVVMCVWILGYGAGEARLEAQCNPSCIGRVCGPDPVCGTSCGQCTEPAICNDDSGHCFELDLNCPAGGPIAQFDPGALGIATNELADGRYNASSRAELLADTGVQRGQIAISWKEIQQNNGDSYAWEEADRQIGALESAGLDPVVILRDLPAWAMSSPDLLLYWRAFVLAAVDRYGGGPSGNDTVHNWQFENEPNLSISPYGGNATLYSTLLNAMMMEVHAADSTARVWGPSVVWLAGNDGYENGGADCTGCTDCTEWPRSLACSQPMTYLKDVLDLGLPDVVSIHIYEPDPERMLDVYLAVVDHLAKRQPPQRAIPIVVNEGHFGFGPGRTSSVDACPYDVGQEVLAQDVASFYSCLLSTNASEVLWFNGSDRFTPGAKCAPDNIRQTGVLGFADNPFHNFEPAEMKNAYFALGAIERSQAARAAAPARLAAVPSTCRIAPGASSCATTLVWTGRYSPSDYPRTFLQVWRDTGTQPVSVGCTAPSAIGEAVVQLDSEWTTFELREVFSLACPNSPTGTVIDRVIARGNASLSVRARGAVFALDSPCSFVGRGCNLAVVWWSDGLTTATYPKVKVFAGGGVYRCADAGATGMARMTGDFANEAGILFRLYEAKGCESGAELGRLLAATRGRGEQAEP